MDQEKRGPVEKTSKGWPVNPFGVVAIVIFAIIIIFLIAKPLLQKQNVGVDTQQNSKGGTITAPNAGDIVHGNNLQIEFNAADPSKVTKVQFWAKSYVNGKWEIIGESANGPYKIDWQIPDNYKNKAIALTTHLFTSDNTEIKDPGGWREGIIILGQ